MNATTKTTIAENIARAAGNDGSDISSLLDELAVIDCSEMTDRDSGKRRFLFEDGSAIVLAEGGWDIEGDEPFSWQM